MSFRCRCPFPKIAQTLFCQAGYFKSLGTQRLNILFCALIHLEFGKLEQTKSKPKLTKLKLINLNFIKFNQNSNYFYFILGIATLQVKKQKELKKPEIKENIKMYRPIQPLQRIDQQIISYPSQLYEPLRKSLLRTNLSQSNISSRSNLSVSCVNDLSSSRVSRRMRSLSPQQAEHIKSNIFVPINKRIVPTKNMFLVKDKKFEAIDVEEVVHKPIPAIRFNSFNRFNTNKVEQIVYQVEEQSQNGRNGQRVGLLSTFGPVSRLISPEHGNIYTNRDNVLPTNVGVSQVREYSPGKASHLGLNTRLINNNFGNSNFPPSPHYQSTNQTNSISLFPVNKQLFGQTGSLQNNNATSFQRASFSPSTLPLQTSTGIKSTSPNLYTSQCNTQIRQLPTQHTLSFLASPLGSRTSFELQKPISQLSKSYDFSKLSQDSSTTQYKQKKKQEWKYNLFSVFDQPANTKCSKTGCFKNQIIASRPNLYEWQQ